MAGALYRQAQLRGLFGGSRPWRLLWGVLFGARLLKRATGNTPEVVFREKLRPGEALVIRNGEPPVRVFGDDAT